MAVPDRTTSRRLLASLDLPDWLVVHSEGVARVAAEAARALVDGGTAVDVALAEAAGRLHDIDKLETLGDGRHGLAAGEQLAALGYPELAGPVASHPLSSLADPARAPRGWEAVCVSVADRRVGTAFMTVAERIEDMAARYPQHAEQVRSARPAAEAFERRLAEAAGVSPEQLAERLRRAWSGPDR